jgi:hypothetical protein
VLDEVDERVDQGGPLLGRGLEGGLPVAQRRGPQGLDEGRGLPAPRPGIGEHRGEGVEQRPEGPDPVQWAGQAAEDHDRRLGPGGEVVEEAGLADARLALQDEAPTVGQGEPVQGDAEPLLLVLPSHQPRAGRPHRPTLGDPRPPTTGGR